MKKSSRKAAKKPARKLVHGQAAARFIEAVESVTYAEYHYFSERNPLWRRYRTKAPRMPTEADRTKRWTNTLFQPLLLNTFFGTHNKKIINTFIGLRDKFEMAGQFPSLFIVVGPPGSGKTSLVQALLSEMCEAIGAQRTKARDFLLELDCENLDVSRMWGRVSAFAQAPSSGRVPYKFVILDSADYITPTSQQLFKKVYSETEKKVKYIFICRSLGKMTGHVLSKGPQYTTHLAKERDALGTFLRILQTEKIGFNREGMEYLFQNISKMNLRECVDIMQQTFLEHFFLSQENLEKVVLQRGNNKRPQVAMPASRAVEPLDRCKICTLRPPCAHTTIQDLEEQGAKRRQELPRFKGGMTCDHYLKHGYCRNFNQYGHCSLDHPRHLHKIVEAPVRCPQCSLVWPCHHCSFSPYRDAVLETVEKLQERYHLLKQIAVESPPVALTSHLVEPFPNFRRLLLKLRKAIPLEKEIALQRAQEWIDTCTSVVKEDYIQKDKMLRVTFDTLLTSRLLDPPESFIEESSSSDDDDEEDEEGGESKEGREGESSGSSDEENGSESDGGD